MGTSNWQNISYNIELVKRLNPKSILDIGVGYGRWGILFREFLEVWGDRNYSGKWNRRIDGIEIFPQYIKPYHKYFYDDIYIENALDFLRKSSEKYDLINCGDVIEHFEKSDGLELIDLCISRSKFVLINIPIGMNWKQETINNNEFEKHRSVWYESDFIKFKHCIIQKFNDIELRPFSVVLISNTVIDFSTAYGKHFYFKSLLKNKLGINRLIEYFDKKII